MKDCTPPSKKPASGELHLEKIATRLDQLTEPLHLRKNGNAIHLLLHELR